MAMASGVKQLVEGQKAAVKSNSGCGKRRWVKE